MSCMQCEQRAGDGCSVVGVCGKDPTTAALQDLLLHQIKAISVWADAGRQRGVSEEALKAANEFTVHALFSTLTNVNFDASRFVEYSREAEKVRQALEALVTHRLSGAEVGALPSVAHFAVKSSLGQAELAALGRTVGLEARETPTTDHDVFGASEMVMYGVKGVAAYAAHALALGRTDPAVYSGVHRALRTISDPKIDLSTALATALDVGGTNVKTMQLLSDAHRGQFGVPEPTAINHAATAGHAILVSGHDLHDLHEILTQTEGKGVNVYTHGEMLPAHTYPGLKKFKHLVGHFGGPWQLQRFEFAKFPGAIVMTTNCIIEPQSRYRDRIFTKNEVGWEGTAHIRGNDYSPVIKAAKAMPGFARTEPERRIMGGFGHEAVLANAGTILDAVQKGNLKHIALVGGCDGTEGDRSYYTDFAKALPPTSAILTLGCGKFRVIGRGDYGNIPGTAIPRVLDMGQCNDSYSAVVVVRAFVHAFVVQGLIGSRSCLCRRLPGPLLPLPFATNFPPPPSIAVPLRFSCAGAEAGRGAQDGHQLAAAVADA
jgi:hydroxylamine reductase